MSNNQCIIPECYIDSCLVEVLLLANKEHVNHQKGNGTVAKEMKEKFENDFCIGIIDEDRRELDYLKEFTGLKENPFLKLWKHKEKHQYIIQIRPVIETWILNICADEKINLTEFGLPSSLRPLMNLTKSVKSKRDDRFARLFKRMLNVNSEPVLELKKWLDYLKEYNYKIDIESLKNLE